MPNCPSRKINKQKLSFSIHILHEKKKANEHQNVFQSEESISKEFCDVFKKCTTSLFRNKRFILDEMCVMLKKVPAFLVYENLDRN